MTPNPGTPCADCKFRGHTCYATTYKNGVPVCSRCAEDLQCALYGAARGTVATPLPTTPQPALAPGAVGTEAMPARRVFAAPDDLSSTKRRRAKAKEMFASGMSVTAVIAAAGISKMTAARIRREMGLLPAERGGAEKQRARKAQDAYAGLTPAEASSMVQRAAAAQVEVARAAIERVPATVATGALPAKLEADGYRVISLAELPGRKYAGVYDEIASEFMKLPKLSVLTKEYANKQIAHTYMLALVRIGRRHGLKMRQKQDGTVIHVWQV